MSDNPAAEAWWLASTEVPGCDWSIDAVSTIDLFRMRAIFPDGAVMFGGSMMADGFAGVVTAARRMAVAWIESR